MDENDFWGENANCHFSESNGNMLTDEIINMIIYQDNSCLRATTKNELRQKQNMCQTS